MKIKITILLAVIFTFSFFGLSQKAEAAACTTATLATGSDPVAATIAPGTAIADRGAFTIQGNNSSCSGTVTAMTVTLAGAGTPYNGLAEVRITNSAGSTTYFSAVTSFASNSVSFSGTTYLPVTTSAVTFKIRVTPKTHANMPAVPGASYAITPYVSAWTTTLTKAGSDTNPNTTTIDNASPNGATSTSGSAGTDKVTLNWTTSNSADFATTNGSVVLRWAAASAGNAVPAEGTTSYTAGNTIIGGDSQTATVACVISSAASTALSNKVDGTGGSTGCNTSALADGQSYSYKVFQVDTNGNYDAGVAIGTFLTTPAAPTNVAATKTLADKVTITWTKSTGATNYHVWRDSTDLGAAGDVATFDDTGAGAPSITAGLSVASDGTSSAQVDLSLSGTSANDGTTYTYKVVASNATGNSPDSATDTGYRHPGSLTYQWRRSAGDSNGSYSDIVGATSSTYADTNAPADGSGRYYVCVLNATGASQQTSTADRGYRNAGSLSVDIVNSGGTSVGSPSVTFDAATFGWSVQSSTGTLGVSDQKIRVNNTTSTPSWNLTINATGGDSALWSDGSHTYDYNGTSAQGRLQVNASTATITPQGGCASTGIGLSSATYFTSGGGAITMVTAGGTTQTNCYWDFTGITLNQDIPASQAAGSYSIGMTLTAA